MSYLCVRLNVHNYQQVRRPVRTISRIISSARTKTKAKNMATGSTGNDMKCGRVELDTHADTIVLGANCTVLSYTGKECDVTPYTDAYDAIRHVPVVSGTTLWTRPSDGQEFILVFNEALWMGEQMQHTLATMNVLFRSVHKGQSSTSKQGHRHSESSKSCLISSYRPVTNGILIQWLSQANNQMKSRIKFRPWLRSHSSGERSMIRPV